MLKFKEINFKQFYPSIGTGMKPGYTCQVELQIGPNSWDSIKIDLAPDEVREIVALAVDKAMARLTLDPSSINVDGVAGQPLEEVDEAPVLAADAAEVASAPEPEGII